MDLRKLKSITSTNHVTTCTKQILEKSDLLKKVVVLLENEKTDRVRKQQQMLERDKMKRCQRAMKSTHWQGTNHFERDMEEPTNGSKTGTKIGMLMNLDRFSTFPYIVVMMKAGIMMTFTYFFNTCFRILRPLDQVLNDRVFA